MLLGMEKPAIVFRHASFTVHAAPTGGEWRGEILTEQGELHDGFSYTRERFPGAVIGALRVRDIAFASRLAERMWLHTDDDAE